MCASAGLNPDMLPNLPQNFVSKKWENAGKANALETIMNVSYVCSLCQGITIAILVVQRRNESPERLRDLPSGTQLLKGGPR